MSLKNILSWLFLIFFTLSVFAEEIETHNNNKIVKHDNDKIDLVERQISIR